MRRQAAGDRKRHLCRFSFFALLPLAALIFGAIKTTATDVFFDLNAPLFNANPATNRIVTLQPLTPFAGNLIFFAADTNGHFTFSNAWVGDFAGQIKAPPASINFQITVTATNLGTVNADTITSQLGIQTYPTAGRSSWTIQTSDQRYQLAGNAQSNFFYPLFSNPSNYVQNAILLAASNSISTSLSATNAALLTALAAGTNAAVAGARVTLNASNTFILGTATNLVLAQGAANTNDTIARVLVQGAASTNDAIARVMAIGVASTNNDMVLSNAVYRAGTNAVSSQSAFNATNGMGNGAFADTNKFASLVQATNIASAMTNGYQQGITNIINGVAGSGNFISRSPGGSGTNIFIFATNNTGASASAAALTVNSTNNTYGIQINSHGGDSAAIGFLDTLPNAWQGTNFFMGPTHGPANAQGAPSSDFIFGSTSTNGGQTPLILFNSETNRTASGIAAPAAYFNALYINGFTFTNHSTVVAGSGVTVSTNGNNYTVTASSQTNNSVFQNGNATNVTSQGILSLGGNTNYLFQSSQIIGVTAAGSPHANGTYQKISANGWTNLSQQQLSVVGIGISSNGTSFFVNDNSIVLYSASAMVGPWSIVNGSVSAPVSWVGASNQTTGILEIGQGAFGTNQFAIITNQAAIAAQQSTNGWFVKTSGQNVITNTGSGLFVTNPASQTIFSIQTNGSVLIGSIDNPNLDVGYIQIKTNGDLYIQGGSALKSGSESSILLSSGNSGAGSVTVEADDQTGVYRFGDLGGVTLQGNKNVDIALRQPDSTTNDQGILDGYIGVDSGTDPLVGSRLGRNLHLYTEPGGTIFLDGTNVTATNKFTARSIFVTNTVVASNFVGGASDLTNFTLSSLNIVTTNSGRISTNFTLLTGQSLTNFVNTNAINLSNSISAALFGTTNLNKFNVNTNLFIDGISQEETFGDTIELRGSSNSVNNLVYSKLGAYWTNTGSGYSVFTNVVGGTNRYNNLDSSGNISFFRNGSPQGLWSANFITTNPPTGDWGRLVNQGPGGGAEALVWSNAVFRGPVSGDGFIIKTDGSADFRGTVNIATLHATNEVIDIIETNLTLTGNTLIITNNAIIGGTLIVTGKVTMSNFLARGTNTVQLSTNGSAITFFGVGKMRDLIYPGMSLPGIDPLISSAYLAFYGEDKASTRTNLLSFLGSVTNVYHPNRFMEEEVIVPNGSDESDVHAFRQWNGWDTNGVNLYQIYAVSPRGSQIGADVVTGFSFDDGSSPYKTEVDVSLLYIRDRFAVQNMDESGYVSWSLSDGTLDFNSLGTGKTSPANTWVGTFSGNGSGTWVGTLVGDGSAITNLVARPNLTFQTNTIYATTNTAPVTRIANPITLGTSLTTYNARTRYTVQFVLNDSAVSGSPALVFTNFTAGTVWTNGNTFVLAAGQTTTWTPPTANPGDVVGFYDKSTGAASVTLVKSEAEKF